MKHAWFKALIKSYINLNILECKWCSVSGLSVRVQDINLNILECKYEQWTVQNLESIILI